MKMSSVLFLLGTFMPGYAQKPNTDDVAMILLHHSAEKG